MLEDVGVIKKKLNYIFLLYCWCHWNR